MEETKCEICFYTIADFSEEEIWLREQHKAGWKLVKMTPPCFYWFERCTPEDVIYRLDFKNNAENADYMQMLEDYGWEYAGKCAGWLYFRKPAVYVEETNEGELFSDNDSRVALLQKIMRTRLLPLAVIFLCCVLPSVRRTMDGSAGAFFTVFWVVMFVLYSWLILHCGLKLKRLKKDLE